MDRAHVGSLLAGFGIISEVLIEQALSQAANISVWTQGVAWTMILLGLALIAIDLREEYEATK